MSRGHPMERGPPPASLPPSRPPRGLPGLARQSHERWESAHPAWGPHGAPHARRELDHGVFHRLKGQQQGSGPIRAPGPPTSALPGKGSWTPSCSRGNLGREMLLTHGASRSTRTASSGDQHPAAAQRLCGASQALPDGASRGWRCGHLHELTQEPFQLFSPSLQQQKGNQQLLSPYKLLRLPAPLKTRNKPHAAAQALHVFGRTQTPDDQSSCQHQTQQHPSRGWATTLRCDHSPRQDAHGCGWDGLVPTQGWGGSRFSLRSTQDETPCPNPASPQAGDATFGTRRTTGDADTSAGGLSQAPRATQAPADTRVPTTRLGVRQDFRCRHPKGTPLSSSPSSCR